MDDLSALATELGSFGVLAFSFILLLRYHLNTRGAKLDEILENQAIAEARDTTIIERLDGISEKLAELLDEKDGF